MQLTVLHTNDIHGKFRDTPATWKDGNPPIGGFANLSAWVEAERATAQRVLLVDGGDLMTGNPLCNEMVDGARGGALMQFMNQMRYDAMALGNHEFDLGLENLDALLGLAQFPVLSANVERPEGGLTTGQASMILDKDGLRIGIIGLTTANLYGVAAPSALAGTQVFPPAEVAQRLVDEIDARTDLIVLLTHIGVDGDRELARRVRGIDVIVGGHSHTRLTEPVVENGVLIVQAGAHNRNLGVLELTVQGDSISAWQGHLVDLWPREGGDAAIRDEVAAWSRRIDDTYGQEIGRLAQDWRRSSRSESNIADWLADCFRARVGADFGFINSGGIRSDLSAGPITRLDILEMLPFGNALVRFECSGADLLTLLRTTAEAAAVHQHGMLHLSGVRYAYAVQGDSVQIVEATVGGEPLDPLATYHGVGNDFVVFGNPMRYMGFEPGEAELLPLVDADVVIEAIESAHGVVESRLDGRLRQVEPMAAER
jgi:2',3'-cyclic-nucleotide 2'-phosphodiesterase (5'-nucleotidase family)